MIIKGKCEKFLVKTGTYFDLQMFFAGSSAVRVHFLAIFIIISLSIIPRSARADRFLENYTRNVPESPDRVRRYIAKQYIFIANAYRMSGRLYHADHFARRAFYFRSNKMSLKAPDLFFDFASIKDARRANMQDLKILLDASLDCGRGNTSVRNEMQAVVAFERLALDLLTDNDRKIPYSRFKILENKIKSVNKDTTCPRLNNISSSGTAVNWDLNPDTNTNNDLKGLQSNEIDIIEIPPSVSIRQAPVFGRKLDHIGRNFQPCNVEISQRTIYFKTDHYSIAGDASFHEIASIASAANPHKHIVVEAHADALGSPSRNAELARARARTVIQALVSNGVAPERLRAYSLGAHCPQRQVGSGELPISANRRVTMKIEK